MSARPLPGVRDARLPGLGRGEVAVLAGLAAVGPVLGWVAAVISPAPAFNDFNSYWLAGRLLERGISPYDLGAVAALARDEGRSFVLGTGFSYPLPFALAMVPLSRLPFESALAIFLGASIAAFGLTVAAWLRWATTWGAEWRPRNAAAGRAGIPAWRPRLAALLVGAFPPVVGTVQAGQVNLLVLALLAPGVRWLLETGTGRRSGGAILVAAASVVKLVPIVVVVPLLLAGRVASAATATAAAGLMLAVPVVLTPAAGGLERMIGLLSPDAYFTNVSINGFVSRLVLPTDRTVAVVPAAFDPALVSGVATVVFGLATLLVLWRARPRLAEPRTLALAIGFAVLAGIMGGPKNSFWNASLGLVTLGLLVASGTVPVLVGSGASPFARTRSAAGPRADDARADDASDPARLDRLDWLLLAAWASGFGVQTLVWVIPPPPTNVPFAPLVTLAGSAALYGMLGLWWLIARRLVRSRGGAA
jgi:hypothetical protein